MRRRLLVLVLLLLPVSTARSGEAEVRLLTDDAIPRYLARGQELAKAEQWDKMVDVLHRVVIGDPEVFPDLKPEVLHSAVYSADGKIYYPARELCLKELSQLPPAGLEAYRNAFDLQARELYAKVTKIPDIGERLTRLAEVYENYLVSTVGDDALEAAGDLDLMLGRYYEALGLFRRLVDVYPKDTDRDLPMVLAKAAFCAARIGDVEARDLLLDHLVSNYPDASVQLESKPVPVAELRDDPRFATRAVRVRTGGDWRMPGGSPARTRVVADLPETLPRTPLWSYRISERDARLTAQYGIWMVRVHDREPVSKAEMGHNSLAAVRPYPTVRPVVHDGIVLYKDYLEKIARRLSSGDMVPLGGRYRSLKEGSADPRFLYPSTTSRPGTGSGPDEAAKYEMILRHHDYGGNTLVVDDERIFSVESTTAPRFLLSVNAPHSGAPNKLIAYARDTGKTLWGWDDELVAAAVRRDPAANRAWQQDFQAHATPYFRGPGVVSSGMLYTLVDEESDKESSVSLWAIDAATGRVRFRTPLHYRDEANRRLTVGTGLAIAGGVVYVVPESGVVAAVDALPPGRVRWIRRYPRNFQSGLRRNRPGRAPSQVLQGFAYNDPVVAGGRVIVAAADSSVLIALDAESGREVWRHERADLGNAYHIVGASNGVLVMAGAHVVGIDLARGKTLWGPVRLEGFPYGRGLVGAKYAYVPVHYAPKRQSGIERFDLRTGERAEPLKFDVRLLGNIVYTDGRLIAATEEQVMCFSTTAAEIERIDRKLREQGERADLRYERGLVALAAEPPGRDAARADFAKALAACDEPDDGISVAAIENLLAIAEERRDLDALDEASAVVTPLAEAERGAPDYLPFHPYQAQIALERARILGQLGRGEESLAALEDFLDRYASGRVRVDQKVVSAPAAAAATRETLLQQNTAFQVAFEKSVRARIKDAYERKDKEALAELPTRYGKRAPAEEAYFALARLCDEENDDAGAELALRRFLREFRDHPRAGEAHLRLAVLLARKGLLVEARRERDEGHSRMDDEGRAANAGLLAELERLLPDSDSVTPLSRLRLPLAAGPSPVPGATPVQLEGTLPEELSGLVLAAKADRYVAAGADGKVLWERPFPAGEAAAPGPAGEAATATAAAAIAGARFARVIGEDLLLGDVGGIVRVSARTGELRWQYPRNPAQAAKETEQALKALREYHRDPEASRAYPLPGFGLAGNVLVRVHLAVGVEAFDVKTGEIVWQDAEVQATPVGPPAVLGQLVAVGWSRPGRVRVYSVDAGDKPLQELLVDGVAGQPGTLLAPPVLDPLGRLVVVTAASTRDRRGKLRVLNARTLKAAHADEYPVYDLNAAVLSADGKVVVYHDGGSSGNALPNLHFLDLEEGHTQSVLTGDMLRDYWLIRDGYRLFVFTHTPGDAGVGARLFRIDLESADVLQYAFPQPLKAMAYARPALTQRYLVVAGTQPRFGCVRLYDREASKTTRMPQAVFAGAGGQVTPEFDFREAGENRYDVAVGVAAAREGLVVSTPFGTARLQAKE